MTVEDFCAGHFDRLNMLQQVMFRSEYERVISNYRLDLNGVHGVRHWHRVLKYGVMVADMVGHDPYPVMLFALLHDSARANEGRDFGHGFRAAMSMSGSHHMFGLKENVFRQLLVAITGHTEVWPENLTGESNDFFDNNGTQDGLMLALLCMDADRLDICRVNADIDEDRLFLGSSKKVVDLCCEITIREEDDFYDNAYR